MIFKFCGNSELAEDAAQDTFYEHGRVFTAINLDHLFATGFTEIATNTALDMLRRQRKTVDFDELPK